MSRLTHFALALLARCAIRPLGHRAYARLGIPARCAAGFLALTSVSVAACGTSLNTGNTHGGTQPSRPASQAASGTCALGPQPPPYDPHYGWPDVTPRYSVTLTDTGSIPDTVTAIAVIFRGPGGSEMASDQQDVTGVIAPAQSLTWSFDDPQQVVWNGQVGTVSPAQAQANGWTSGDELDQAQALATSCQLVQWFTRGAS
jgi:hypothetical protein